MSDKIRLICVGTPSELIQSRQLVLESAGYNVTCVELSKALSLPIGEAFDVMILSVTLIESERCSLRKIAGDGVRIVQLDIFTPPAKLLKLLSQL